MIIPQQKLEDWTTERVDECTVSRKERASAGRYWNDYYFNGSDDMPAMYNRCFSHVDRTASFLFSPADVRFMIEYDITMDRAYLERADVASRFLSREFHRSGSDLQFAAALEVSLIKGSSFMKMNWGHDGLDANIVHPESFGVLREDISSLDKQEAFVHTIFLTPGQFRRNIAEHPDREAIYEKVKRFASSRKGKSEMDGSFMQQIVMGGISPIGTSGSSTGRGSVAAQAIPQPMMDPSVRQKLIKMDELWVWDDDRDDWTTIQLVDPNIIIEGKYKRRNLSGVRGEQPFTKVCANDVDGYFWGRSELAPVRLLQDLLNRRIDEYDRLSEIRALPPKAYIGFNGITDEINTMMNTPGGFMTESTPNAKVDVLAPQMPPDIFQGINEVIKWFDDVAGFENVMKGQGESGVRAGAHAETLMRSAGNRLRDRALLVERQVGNVGDFCFKVLQNKEAKIFVTKEQNVLQKLMGQKQSGEEFLLSQMPDDYRVMVDSHSASPAFSEDARQMAYELAKLGAIDATSIIEMVHPPMADLLIKRAHEKEEAQAQMIKEHPELLSKKTSHKKK
jgi:hypothetical protein